MLLSFWETTEEIAKADKFEADSSSEAKLSMMMAVYALIRRGAGVYVRFAARRASSARRRVL